MHPRSTAILTTAAQGGASLYLKTQAQTCPILDLPEVVIGRCGHTFRGEVTWTTLPVR